MTMYTGGYFFPGHNVDLHCCPGISLLLHDNLSAYLDVNKMSYTLYNIVYDAFL